MEITDRNQVLEVLMGAKDNREKSGGRGADGKKG